MKRLLAAIMLVACLGGMAEEPDPFAELNAKITNSLKSDRWNEASKVFVRALWADYMNAHLNPVENTGAVDVYGAMPDVKNADEYVGAYEDVAKNQPPDQARPSRPAPSLTIGKTAGGQFFVELEGHRIPAVFCNRSIYFTTGDVVYSDMPGFGGKPYCTLEMYMVRRHDGKFYFAGLGMPPDKWREMGKRELLK